jgi:hypothetical protein
MRTRVAALLAATALLWGCAAQPIVTGQPTPSGPAVPSGAPPTGEQPSGAPLPTGLGPLDDDGLPEIPPEALNPPVPPHPEPTLDVPFAIADAMATPGREEQAIVSMLRALNVGLYSDDGTPIRPGTETTGDDLVMTETEAHGLAEMLRLGNHGEGFISFRDFTAELADFGVDTTPDDLLTTYLDVYAQYPDSPMTIFVQNQAFLDVDADISPLGEWLLFVDGLVPPHGATQQAQARGTGRALAQGSAPNIGQGWAAFQQRYHQPDVQRSINAARIRGAMDGAHVALAADLSDVHEGHGGTGTPTTFRATVSSYTAIGLTNYPCEGGGMSGVPITWSFDGALTGHGSSSVGAGASSPTDGSGVAKLVFTPKKEEMEDWHRGQVVREVASVTATVSSSALGRAMCPGVPVLAARRLVQDGRRLVVRWHEPKVMDVTLENPYGVILDASVGGDANYAGEDSFIGRMYEKDDGTWQGMFVGLTQSEGSGVFWAHDPECVPEFGGLQVLEVFGEKRAGRLPGAPFGTNEGDMVLEFFPAAPGEALAGTLDCPSARWPGSRYDYLPFNDAAIYDPDVGLAIELPDEGTHLRVWIYPLVSEITNIDFVRGTQWTVTIHIPQEDE